MRHCNQKTVTICINTMYIPIIIIIWLIHFFLLCVNGASVLAFIFIYPSIHTHKSTAVQNDTTAAAATILEKNLINYLRQATINWKRKRKKSQQKIVEQQQQKNIQDCDSCSRPSTCLTFPHVRTHSASAYPTQIACNEKTAALAALLKTRRHNVGRRKK